MKQIKKLIALGIVTFIFSACQKEAKLNVATGEIAGARNPNINNVVGHVYTLSNQTAGNEVMDYTRSVNGKLTWSASYSAGGNGTGAALGSQGALVMTDNGNYLLAVNAGSNSISSLKISNGSAWVISTVNSGGMMPISIAQYNNLVFVLNAGGNGNICGFTMDSDGNLSPIAGSTHPLSSNASGPAQISFVQDGTVLAITEKATNKIISYTVDGAGMPGMMHSLTSANPTPFGFAVGHNNMIYVTEADGGNPGTSTVSAYNIWGDGSITLSTGPVGAGQTAACWAVATNNGKYVYATNTGDNNVSSFVANAAGGLDVLEANAGNTEGGPIDAALSNNSKYLYVLNAGGHSISAFSVGSGGGLDNIQTMAGVPVGAAGLVAK